MTLPFFRRIAFAFAALLFGFSGMVAWLGHRASVDQEKETAQRLSHGLARHIVEHWPEISRNGDLPGQRATLDELLHMLMTVNPGIEVYLLDSAGRVQTYLGDPAAVREPQVDLEAVRAFLSGDALPLTGSDPRQPGVRKIFSAAMFPPDPGTTVPPGYLYVVLDGEERARVAGHVGSRRLWATAVAIVAAGLIATLAIGYMVFRKLTTPLRRVANEMRDFTIADGPVSPRGDGAADTRDEVTSIDRAFRTLARRIESEVSAREHQQAAQREVIANVAHDLRTPLTALHGYLETLSLRNAALDPTERSHYLAAALGQSEKVRRLSRQLFELARLQSVDRILQHDRFRLDELVQDTVRTFGLSAQPAPVAIAGVPPGRVEMEGDIELIDRALTNLIDNAIRHGRGERAVQVSLLQKGRGVAVLVEDSGPGLPEALAGRLASGQPVRDAFTARPGGGFGGLGLAIAQRIAWLHGGSLRTLPSPHGGTRMCLTLPLDARPPPATPA